MSNQPDIVQPRIRRTGRSGNAPALLAEQSTRVLIRVPRLSTSSTQSQPIPPQSSQAQSSQPKQLPGNLVSAPTTSGRTHYSTTTELLQGSPLAERPPAPLSPPTAPRQAKRIDAAHTAPIAPHLAAPAWLDDRTGWANNRTQTRLLLVVGVIAGFALGALTWHGRGNHSAIPADRDSRNPSTTQGSPDQPRSATTDSDTAAVEFNLPAQISRGAAGPTLSNESTGSTWNWNPKGAANAPASLDDSDHPQPDTESVGTPSATSAGDVHGTDPSRAAWLQGTINTIHSPSSPVQR